MRSYGTERARPVAAGLSFCPRRRPWRPRPSPVVSSGLASPTFVTNAGDGSNRLFILEQAGIIRVLQPGSSSPTLFLDIHTKVVAGGEQGLLGLAFHPLYSTNGRFFVYYTRTGDGTLVIAEYPCRAATATWRSDRAACC